LQFRFRKSFPVLRSWRRYDPGYDLNPAAPACSYAAADADKIHIQQARAFQKRVVFRAEAASSHRLKFNVVHGSFHLSKEWSVFSPHAGGTPNAIKNIFTTKYTKYAKNPLLFSWASAIKAFYA
jgi:hypothetical protein